MFMSFNSTGKEGAVGGVRSALFEQFTDRYFPAPVPNEPTVSTAVEHGQLVAGRYQSSRRAEHTFFVAVGMLGQFDVVANADGTLVLPPLTGLNGQPKVWHEVAPFVWREVGGKERLAAKIENGQVRFLGHDTSSGIQVFMPVSAGTSGGWIIPIVLLSAVSLLLTVIAWPVAALIRRRHGVTFEMTKQQTLARRLLGATAIVNLAFLIGGPCWCSQGSRISRCSTAERMFGSSCSNCSASSGWLALVSLCGMPGCRYKADVAGGLKRGVWCWRRPVSPSHGSRSH
jgi:hypothetical protein